MHPKTCILEQTRKHPSTRSHKTRSPPSQIQNQMQTLTEDARWWCTADPRRTVYQQNHTRGQSKLQLCALFIVTATPGSSGFFGVFLSGRTFVTLPLYSLRLAPHLALFLGLGGTSLVAPQSLCGVSPGDIVGGKQAWSPPKGSFLRGRASIAVWGPCSGLIWGRKAGSERDRGFQFCLSSSLVL